MFSLARTDGRNDSVLYYKIKNGKERSLAQPMTQREVDALTVNMNPMQKRTFFETHLCVRQDINHPNISGPFETGWGYDDFDGAGLANRIGLPQLPGQVTTIKR